MTKRSLQPIDQLALTLIGILSIIIAILIWGGQACGADCTFQFRSQVNFSWQGKEIGAEDRAFLLTFDRPVNQASVAENLIIEPSLPGKISWAGRRLAYTLESPAPYGENYRVYLDGAQVQFAHQDEPGQVIPPFVGQFQTRDRAFAYIGTQAEEGGRLVFYNLTEDQKIILSPPELVVMDFQFYPTGERILFSAVRRDDTQEALTASSLYTVTTGVDGRQAGEIALVLDSHKYQNNYFDLSKDGQTIVVGRVNRQNPADFGLWTVQSGKKPQPLQIAGGEFLIAPDSQTLAVAVGEGISLFSLEPGSEPLDFLPQFGRILGFSRDGSAAVMVNFNTDNPELIYTRSLYYVNNQGVQKELLNIEGSILECKFNPSATNLYCLLTKIVEGEEYQEQPYIAQIDLSSGEVLPLLTLPHYQDTEISLAPDGLGLLFDQIVTADPLDSTEPLRTDSGEAITKGQLWLLILSSQQGSNSLPQLEPLPFFGIRPQWLP